MARTTPVRRALVALVGGIAALVSAAVAPPASAGTPPASIQIRGYGYGHGRGMGQWGALGYAVDHGWSGTQILDRYYGGTSTVRMPDDPVQRVRLDGQVGRSLVVTAAGQVRAQGGGSVVGPAKAIMVIRLSDTTFRVYTGPGCAGPWTLGATIGSTAEVAVNTTVTQTEDLATLPQLCRSGGTTYYRGDLTAVHVPGSTWTVNRVGTENLIRSVIAQEMSPSWADLGGGRGAAALRAQALAARSYVRAGDARWAPYATTCDGTSCQAYFGAGSRSSGSTTPVRKEDPRTDKATRDTQRQVRRSTSTGTISLTEFSASTGGWTAGGTFPAVADAGDDYAGNSNHAWTVTLSRATVEAAFDRWAGRDLGNFHGLDVLSRNGLGADGGRVLTARARFSSGNVSVTGDQVQSILRLRSNWFATPPT
ncbi:MAG: stage II sporulation protein [Actinobacteria bacterium]|nr:stage II sporulation protein [Actinomycetota bacterium]